VRQRLLAERGLATVEFALIAPVLLLMLLGIIQIGLYMFKVDDIRDATRDGARVLTLSRNDPNAEKTVDNAIIASLGGEVDTSKLTIKPNTPAPWAPGSTVTLTVTYPESLSLMGINITGGPITSTATVTIE
jgi:Flp pilus assembly protein TadG